MRICALTLMLILPLLNHAQHFRMATWKMTFEDISEVETVKLKLVGNHAVGEGVDILGETFDVRYDFTQDDVISKESYAKIFLTDDERDAFADRLMTHLASIYGEPHSTDIPQWIHEEATISVDKAPRSLTLDIENPETYYERLKRREARVSITDQTAGTEDIGAIAASSHPIRLKSCEIVNLNSNRIQDVQVQWNYYGSRTIESLYLYFTPYNGSGRTQRCEKKGHSTYRAEIKGPFNYSEVINTATWPDIWKNDDIACVAISRVEVEYANGESQVYVTDLSLIQWSSFANSCRPE